MYSSNKRFFREKLGTILTIMGIILITFEKSIYNNIYLYNVSEVVLLLGIIVCLFSLFNKDLSLKAIMLVYTLLITISSAINANFHFALIMMIPVIIHIVKDNYNPRPAL